VRAGTLIAAFFSATLVCALAAAAYGQTAEQGGGRPPPEVGDEVQVIGQNPAELRSQIQRAEQVFYDRFNAINSRDEFDITCDYQVQTGSKMPRRVCQANFWAVAQAKAAHEGVLRQHGSANAGSAQFEGEARAKQQELAEEMRRLVATDPELARDASRLGVLQQALARRSAADSDQDVPPDVVITKGKVGSGAWEHALQWRTFTIANPSAKLRAIEVHCSGRTETLQWSEDAEWRLPDDWADCGLLVEARAGTTFTLYEFKNAANERSNEEPKPASAP
jgi:hypothetical protein